VRENPGFDFEVNVLCGVEEAKLGYLGVLQFSLVHDKTVLTLDIEGGQLSLSLRVMVRLFLLSHSS